MQDTDSGAWAWHQVTLGDFPPPSPQCQKPAEGLGTKSLDTQAQKQEIPRACVQQSEDTTQGSVYSLEKSSSPGYSGKLMSTLGLSAVYCQ